MTKKYVVECDLCGEYCDEHRTFVMELRPDLAPGQSGDVEKWDVCPNCRVVLLDFFKSRKPIPPIIKIDDVPQDVIDMIAEEMKKTPPTISTQIPGGRSV